MCNLYTQSKSVDEIAALFRDLQMPLTFPEGIPNLAPRDIAITDPGPIVRASPTHRGTFELVIRRWSWPAPNDKPVYNFKSEGRSFPSGRCLAIADGFYEFTAPKEPKKTKDRWLFSHAEHPMVAIAAITRANSQVGEAYTLLTAEPGEDVVPYHHRQIVVLPPSDWRAWLEGAPERDLLKAQPGGSLTVCAAPRAVTRP